MVRFFKDLESEAAKGNIHVILDNAAAHRSRKVKEYLKERGIPVRI